MSTLLTNAKKYVYIVAMKHDSLRKLDRNQQVYAFYLSHPELALQEIGKQFNLSRQRISQIIQSQKNREQLLNVNVEYKQIEVEMTPKKSAWDNQRIRALRQHLKLTQAAMANELGTRQQTVSEWEVGMYKPRGTSVTLLNIVAERSGFQYKADSEE